MPYVDFGEDVYPYLSSDVDREIYSRAVEKFKSGTIPSVSALYSEYDPRDIAEIVEYEFVQGDDEAKYRACVNKLKIERLEADKKRLTEEYAASRDVKLLNEIAKIDGMLRNLKIGGTNDYI